MKGEQRVELTNSRGVKREFALSHALKLLQSGSTINGKPTWRLTDKDFEFKKNDIIKRKSSRTTKEADK